MFSHYERLEKLNEEKVRLEEKIESIKRDLRHGLDATKNEQAIQLENYEVLMEILKVTESELSDVNSKIYQLENTTS